MLSNSFYTILQISELVTGTSWSISIKLHPEHPVYTGHFPEQAVVPGVCMLQIIKECFENVLNTPFQYKQIASCKFLTAILPLENPTLEIQLSVKERESSTVQIQATGKTKDNDFIKLKATLISK